MFCFCCFFCPPAVLEGTGSSLREEAGLAADQSGCAFTHAFFLCLSSHGQQQALQVLLQAAFLGGGVTS